MSAALREPAWREPGQVKDAAYLAGATLRYDARDGEIVGRDGSCFNNRPLYCEARTECVVLAGDRPFVRLLSKPFVLGGFSLAILREGGEPWCHEYSSVESGYHCGRMSWHVSDSSLPGVSVGLRAVPLAGAAGFALRFSIQGARPGDRCVWAFGGARDDGDVRWKWDPVMQGNPKVFKMGDPRRPLTTLATDAASCRGNSVDIGDGAFRLTSQSGAAQAAVGRADRPGRIFAADASAIESPGKLCESVAGDLPLVCGVIELRASIEEATWVVEARAAETTSFALPMDAPGEAFRRAEDYLHGVERVRVRTPEPRLDAAVAAVCHAVDGSTEHDPFIFRHGCMAFSIPFLGWRVICGATALGWHDRVAANAAHYIALQEKETGARTVPQAHADHLGVIESPDSRLHGRGRVIPWPNHWYNTQSQFFDQTIRDWRASGDPELERILLPALELHLEWARECFDPDDDGLYESYINTLPTDSVWYNGGGSVEESAYVHYAHLAARDMLLRAGDEPSAARHQARADKIRQALTDVLWLADAGHFALYREQGGHRRVHSDAWVYSEFLPIDAGVATPEQALQALYYTEWGLERIALPYGGVLCQPSNWVPWKWSVRDPFGGDSFHLALASFQTGRTEEGWQLLLGSMLDNAYAGAVPGGFSHIGAGCDFADNSHMFARVVVEGLFGYDPDYPNGVVRVRPGFPAAWPAASIATPDFSLGYRQDGSRDIYELSLARPADVDFRIPVRAERILRVSVDGAAAAFQVEPGYGCTWLRLRSRCSGRMTLVIGISGRIPHGADVSAAATIGDAISLAAPRGRIARVRDFHGAVEDAVHDGAVIRGRAAALPGHHLVLAEVIVGSLPQWQVFKVTLTDPSGDSRRSARTPRVALAGAAWRCLDLSAHYNADVRAIFQQKYLSPRPRTCSVRLGTDGYSAWCFPFWGDVPPVIDLGYVKGLTDAEGRIMTPQGVPFTAPGEERNIAFTSLWDNWPRSVGVRVDQEADAVWLLVCGTTFPMQTRIANAVLRFRYADGVTENLELVPPLNFWNLCPWGGGDYSYTMDAFCLPPEPPPTVQLGTACRAMVLSWTLRPGIRLSDVTLETLSQDVVIGLMGISLQTPRA